MRSVHTLASVHSHRGGTSLPCLAPGTPGSLICSCVSFTLPPSCPPSLHGRYPLPRYYGDSDSCPAPSSTRTGLLGSRTCTSRHSVSTHPMRPRPPAMLLAPGRLGPRFALLRYRRFFGLRSFLAVSSVASGRIEFVSRRLGAAVLRTIRSLPVALHPTRRDAVTFSYRREAPPGRDFHPPCTLAPKRTRARLSERAVGDYLDSHFWDSFGPTRRARETRLPGTTWATCPAVSSNVWFASSSLQDFSLARAARIEGERQG